MSRDPVFRVSLVLVVLAAGVALLVPRLDPAVVEQAYSRGVYPGIVAVLDRASGWTSISITEPGAAIGGAVLLVALWRGRGRLRTWVGLVGFAAVAWLLFQGLWGLNYRRQPVARAFGLEVRPSEAAEVRGYARWLVREVDALGDAWTPVTVPEMLAGGPRVYTDVAGRWPFLDLDGPPPKPLVASSLLSWLGLLGFYDPYTAEPNLNVEVPPFVIPFVVLHEMAHQRGIASEDEASFVGYRLGLEAELPDFRYASLWEGVIHVAAAWRVLDPEGYPGWWASLPERVRVDTDTYLAWRAAHLSPLEGLARAVNDTYLKSQGVPDGVLSYGRVTDLMLADWRARAEAGP